MKEVLFINPGNAKSIYQNLANEYSAIETPTWSLLLAESCRSIGHDVGILDQLRLHEYQNVFPSGLKTLLSIQYANLVFLSPKDSPT